jgi:hypothetical protein
VNEVLKKTRADILIKFRNNDACEILTQNDEISRVFKKVSFDD